MTLLLVRHAVALRRADWTKPDGARPLTPRGSEQAERLVDLLSPYGVDRILSSGAVRCVDTVQPLAARLGLPVEAVDELAEGAGAAAAGLVRDLAGVTVLCTHGDVLPELFAVLVTGRLDADVAGAGEVRFEKGSTWVVDGGAARYLPPPA